MKTFLFVFILISFAHDLSAQYVYTIRADSVKLTNCDSSELIIENHTQGVPGFLFNTGNGRTVFKRGVSKISGGLYLIGADTLNLGVNAWVQGGNSFGATGFLGTLDNNHLDFYTNNARQVRLTNTGNLLVGSIVDNGDKFQVHGNGAMIGPLNTGVRLLMGDSITNNAFGIRSYGDTANGSNNHYATIGLNLQEPYAQYNTSKQGGGIYFDDRNGVQPIRFMVRPPGVSYIAAPAGVVTSTGNFLMGTTTDNGSKLQVDGSSYFNGPQQITGTVGGTINVAHTTFNPTITALAQDYTNFWGTRMTPTMNFSGNYQQAYAADISPVFNLNGYSLSGDVIASALHIGSSLGGITIDQSSSYVGATGQPLYIAQGPGTDKEVIRILRLNNSTNRAFIWNDDVRLAATRGSVIPALRSSIRPFAGGGVSFTLDRIDYGTEASVDMKYELTPAEDTASTIKTAIAFNTIDLGYRSAALYISGSKVGIGTTTPSSQLHTTGTVCFAGLTNDTTKTRVLVSDANGNLYYRDASTLASNGILNADLANGNAILSSLAVNGTIAAQRLKLSQTGWPDYVFGRNYDLPKLNEIEEYIRRNGHLPGIPSAAEVEKKGVDVGDHQAAVLKKIEELTLYNIAQEKELKDQNKRLETQATELSALKQEIAELKKMITGESLK
ncbi:MAG TPA: hypothetical protein VNS58_05150 [Puia sp.]|nr:hypothetical protein [Puia sp.]